MDLSQEVTLIVIGSAFFLLVAVGIIILILIYQKRQLRHILEKANLQNQFQNELMKTRLESREETLNQLSTELHDNIGQLLSSSKILIGTAERMIDKPSEQLQMAGETISKAIRELRAISKSLNTEWLEKFSLIENLQSESDRITTSKEINVTLQHPPVIEMPMDRQMMLFRIVQEALQNTIKHGEASRISIVAEQKESMLQISIADDGKGFDAHDETIQGVGILNIKHRTRLMSGEVQWNSTKDGTSVIIQLPLYAS